MKPSQQRHARHYLIHAGKFAEAASYAMKHNLPLLSWSYLDSPDKLRGNLRRNTVVVKTGTFWDHDHARKIAELITSTCVENEYDS